MSERMSARDVLAAELGRLWTEPEDDRDLDDWKAIPGKLLDALKASGYAVVELPKPIGPDDDGQLYFGDYDIRVDNTGGSRVGDVWTDYGLGSEVLSQIGVFRARYMGIALLAAAAAAERDSEER